MPTENKIILTQLVLSILFGFWTVGAVGVFLIFISTMAIFCMPISLFVLLCRGVVRLRHIRKIRKQQIERDLISIACEGSDEDNFEYHSSEFIAEEQWDYNEEEDQVMEPIDPTKMKVI